MGKTLIQKNTFKFISLVTGCVLFLFTITEASLISINAPTSTSVGERISIDVLVDPQNQSINSIESTVKFNTSLFDFNGFSVKQSSIPIWVEEPKEKEKGGIHFSGVIPGGIDRLYDPLDTGNKAIPVVRLFFIAKKSGDTGFVIGNSQVLENDGKGTTTTVTVKDAKIAIANSTRKGDSSPLLADISAPDPFTISIVERSVFGKTPKLATFSAEDEAGGIEHYEVAIGHLGFQRATSPFVLPYRLFPYTLTARAYDYSGNFREQQITVDGDKPYGVGAILIIILLGLLGFSFYRKVKRV